MVPTPVGLVRVCNYGQGKGLGNAGGILYERLRTQSPRAVPVFIPSAEVIREAIRASKAIAIAIGGWAILPGTLRAAECFALEGA